MNAFGHAHTCNYEAASTHVRLANPTLGVHVLLVQMRRRRAPDLQHVAHLVAHNHVEAKQTVARINDARCLQLHLAQLVHREIAGQDLRTQPNQLEDFVAQLPEVGVAGQVEMLEQIAPVGQHCGDFAHEIGSAHRVVAVVDVGLDQLHVGFRENSALRFVSAGETLVLVVAPIIAGAVLTCLCIHSTSRCFREE